MNHFHILFYYLSETFIRVSFAFDRLFAAHHEAIRSLRPHSLPDDQLHGLASQIPPFPNTLELSG